MAPSIWTQPMFVVDDVEASSAFYCEVFGFLSGHGGDAYEQLLHDGELVMQLHDDDPDDHHGPLVDRARPTGNGVLIWIEVADFDGVVARARARDVDVVSDVHTNTSARQQEFWFRDLDGYLVVVAGESAYRPR
ncbi:MAG: VOC family protein [Actinomycetota bacterium]